ncbi:MAG: hypothetical protein JST93_12385 [Acidobacteria bacterium]|nr:hypothetical protein [Acidobacteriota bacterium]
MAYSAHFLEWTELTKWAASEWHGAQPVVATSNEEKVLPGDGKMRIGHGSKSFLLPVGKVYPAEAGAKASVIEESAYIDSGLTRVCGVVTNVGLPVPSKRSRHKWVAVEFVQ